MENAAGRAEELAFLFQEGSRFPAGAVALQHMLFRVKASFGIILQDRHPGLAFLPDHHAPDHLSFHFRHAGKIRIEGRFIAAPDEFVKRHGLGSAVGIFRLVDHAAF